MQVSFAAIPEDVQARDFLSFQELLHLCCVLFPRLCGCCPRYPTVMCWNYCSWNYWNYCLICPHVTGAVCLLFALECEFDLEEIKVTWDFQRKLGNLGMSRVFWNRQWFGLSQHKQKERSSLLELSCGFRVTEIWEALGEMKKASLSLKSSASPLGQEGICAWLWVHS